MGPLAGCNIRLYKIYRSVASFLFDSECQTRSPCGFSRGFRVQGQPRCDSSGPACAPHSRAKCDHVLWVIMYWHCTEDLVASSGHEELFLAEVKLGRGGLDAGQGLKLDDFALYVNTTRRLQHTGNDNGKPNLKSA